MAPKVSTISRWDSGEWRRCCSFWPWMSPSHGASDFKSVAVAGRFASRARDLPEAMISRSTMSSSSSRVMPASSSSARKAGACGTEKTPEMRARSVPVRTTSAEARPPNRSPSESTMIDLPLPVSPVNRFRPVWNRSRRRSTTAKFSTCNSTSILFSLERRCRVPPLYQ